MAGRKPIDPSGAVRNRLVVMVTPLEAESVLAHLQTLRGVPVHASDGPYSAVAPSPNDKVQSNAFNAPKTVKLPVVELHDESDDAIRKVFDAGDLYVPSMRECRTCGKDYDGNLHDSCPHEHVPNGKGRK